MNAVDKIKEWFGARCSYRHIQGASDESSAMFIVNDGDDFHLARVLPLGDNLDISVDYTVKELDVESARNIIERVLELRKGL
jgi:hypothetical protein